MGRRTMQGRIGPLVLVMATAALLTACDLPLDDVDDSADYAQVCTDAVGHAEPDSDCDTADDDYLGSTYVAGRPYMWRYYPASNLTIAPYGQLMPAGGTVRRPSVITVAPAAGATGSAGGYRPAKIQTPSADSAGGVLTRTGSASSISRGGFGVKSGSTGGKGSSGSAGS